MAAITFPDSPTNGEEFDAPNGVTYTYNTVDDSWTGNIPVSTSAQPTLSELTASPPFVSGVGTQEDPYVITPATSHLAEV